MVFILDRRRRVKIVPFTAGGGNFSGFWCLNNVFYKEGKGYYLTKNCQNRSKINHIIIRKPPPVSPRFSTRGGAFLYGFYFGPPKAGQGSTLTPPEAENFQDFGAQTTFFIREINGFTWYIRKISPCGAKENTLPT